MKQPLIFFTVLLASILNVGVSKAQCPGPNLVVNGSFSAGNTGFTSNYHYDTTLHTIIYPYTVGSDAANYNGWSQIYDHTCGCPGGEYLLTNICNFPALECWNEGIPVKRNTYYTLSFWGVSIHNSSQASIIVFFNAAASGQKSVFPDTLGVWRHYTEGWCSGTDTSVYISIVNFNDFNGVGNAFGLDDISFNACCTDSLHTTLTDARCFNDSNGSASITAMGCPGFTYYWTPIGATTAAVTGLKVGNYTVEVDDANNCRIDTTITIASIYPPAVGNACCDTTIGIGHYANLKVSPFIYNDSYVWAPSFGLSCSTCPNTIVTPLANTTYYLTITDSDGCTNRDAITVDVSCGNVFVPEAFSPNGDGQNDVLYVRGDCINTLSFIVFDRWGNKVFETTDKNIGWNGVYKGEAMNTGSYVYYLKASMYDGSAIEKKGNITLVR